MPQYPAYFVNHCPICHHLTTFCGQFFYLKVNTKKLRKEFCTNEMTEHQRNTTNKFVDLNENNEITVLIIVCRL